MFTKIGLFSFLVVGMVQIANGHGGGEDSSGCHNDNSNGTRHCHNPTNETPRPRTQPSYNFFEANGVTYGLARTGSGYPLRGAGKECPNTFGVITQTNPLDGKTYLLGRNGDFCTSFPLDVPVCITGLGRGNDETISAILNFGDEHRFTASTSDPYLFANTEFQGACDENRQPIWDYALAESRSNSDSIVTYRTRYISVGDINNSIVTIEGMGSNDPTYVGNRQCQDGKTYLKWSGNNLSEDSLNYPVIFHLGDTSGVDQPCQFPTSDEICVLKSSVDSTGFYMSIENQFNASVFTSQDLDAALFTDECYIHEDNHKVYRVLYRNSPPLECSVEPADIVVGTNPTSDCDYTNASQSSGWGWNAASNSSCAPLNSRLPIETSSIGGCEYIDADRYDGWGWNPLSGESCPPL